MMAKLILTEKEKQSPFLEWDDVALGRAVKAVASVCGDDNGRHAIKATGAAVFLIAEAVRSGATDLEINLIGASDGAQSLGNWRISIEQQKDQEVRT
jgi:hypothetical protein